MVMNRGKKTGSDRGPKSAGVGFDAIRVERDIGGRPLILETGRMAKQADGAVLARYGDTMILATAQSAPARPDIDFLPLTVDYREKAAAAGKFPGGFFKREGRPTAREILVCRIIDRAIRPLFPKGFRKEIQLLVQVLCTDQENEADIAGAVAAFAALAISSIPHEKILGACRIGMRGDKMLVNPTWSDVTAPDCDLNLTVAAHKGAIVMVEAGGNQIPEDVMLDALELAHKTCNDVVELVEEFVEKAGKAKYEWTAPERDESVHVAVNKKFGKQLASVVFAAGNKFEQDGNKKALLAEVVEAFPAPDDCSDREAANHQKEVKTAARECMDKAIRDGVLDGKRVDGRGWTDIRPISVEVDVMPRCHGSSLFTRGETQALCTATLGTRDDEQRMDGIYPEDPKRFLLHYSFPPFCVGEVRRFGMVGRREIGHGALAERSVQPVVPSVEEFPYSLRITSEILESNGSSSMASVCGATLALMDAGVPLKQPVAGIAMGLVVEGRKSAIISDILGTEDHCGDMDFKVAGTAQGINALQMDIKCEGLSRELLEQALEQARAGRLHILKEMLKVIRQPREDISPNAPRLESVKVPADKIGLVIGPGGRHVRQMQEDFKVRVNISDDGTVQIAGSQSDLVIACAQKLKDMTAEIEVGTLYKGRVTSIKEFGAFIEILPGQEGLCHVSELSDEFVRSVTDVARIGDEIEVKVIDIDDFGKVKLSRRAVLDPGSGDKSESAGGRRDRGDRGDRGGRGERGGRGGRGERGDRERPRRRDDAEGSGDQGSSDQGSGDQGSGDQGSGDQGSSDQGSGDQSSTGGTISEELERPDDLFDGDNREVTVPSPEDSKSRGRQSGGGRGRGRRPRRGD